MVEGNSAARSNSECRLETSHFTVLNALPLVTVGIPTRNRAAGLRRTLECITRQTYRNLEIIVADNCSDQADVQGVVDEFAQSDERIHAFRHDANLGIGANFRFVLRRASGTYFMWAADDDEHSHEFIEVCLRAYQESDVFLGSVMTQFNILNRFKGEATRVAMPSLLPRLGIFESVKAHLDNLTPGLIYALHRRQTIAWLTEYPDFDWLDCYFTTRNLLNGYPVAIVDNYVGYSAGIDAPEYVPKPMRKRSNALFEYMPYAKATLKAILAAKGLTWRQKLVLSARVCEFSVTSFLQWERPYRPWLCRINSRVSLPLITKFRQFLKWIWPDL
jgi:glycosyltransferase involved in cell wall biosynthesis